MIVTLKCTWTTPTPQHKHGTAHNSTSPLQETHLCRYVSWLAKDNIAHTTVKSYLSALRHLQIARNHPDPMISTFPKLEGGIKMQQARQKTSPPKRLPINLHKLRSFFASKGNEAVGGHMHLLLWLHAVGRNDHPIGVCIRPILPPMFQWRVIPRFASKTDPFRQGVEIVLPIILCAQWLRTSRSEVAFYFYLRTVALSPSLDLCPKFETLFRTWAWTVRWPLLSDWGRHCCRGPRSQRTCHPNAGQMEKLGIPTLYSHPKGQTR